MSGKHTLVLQPELSEVHRARSFVQELAVEAGFGPERVFDIMVAVSEAAANAIEHAYGAGEVSVEVNLPVDRLEVSVQGTGEFHLPAQTDGRAHRGLGLPLMATLADHLALYSVAEGGTLVTLTFYLPGATRDTSTLPPGLAELLAESSPLPEVMNNLPDAFVVFDHDWRHAFVNEAQVALSGKPATEMLGRAFGEVFPEALTSCDDDGVNVFEQYEKARNEGLPVHFVFHHKPLGHWFEYHAFPITEGLAVFTRDITVARRAEAERKQVEESLRKSEERIRLALKSAQVTAYEVDREQRYAWFHNPHPGLGNQDLTGRTSDDIFSSAEVERVIELRRRVMETGESIRQELTLPLFGERRTYDYSMEPVRDATGEVSGALVAAVDITERKRAEEALTQNEATLRGILEAATESIWLFSPDNVILAGNAMALRRMGRPAEEIIGKRFSELLPPELAKARTERVQQVVESGEPVEFEDERAGMTFLHTFCPVGDNEGGVRCVACFSRDITERKRVEAELVKLNRTFKALSDSDQALVRAVDESTYLQEVSRIIVEDCGHAMVWTGFAENDEGKTVRVAASAGFEEGYLDTLNITWADTERGRGPTGTAIRTKEPSICRDMTTETRFAPWRDEAARRGYASSISIPLMIGRDVLGAITIYSREPDSFSDEETNLLKDLADDLALGISTLRLRAVHAAAEHERELLIEQLQETSEELAASNEELQNQAEELAAQTEELAAHEEELAVHNEELSSAYARLDEANRLEQAFNRTVEALGSTLDFSEVLHRVVREGALALGAERAVFELRQENGWVVQELLGLPEELRGMCLSEDEASVATAMYRQGDLLAIVDGRDDPRVSKSTVWRYGTRAALAVPVALRGHVLGSLQFIWASAPREFKDAEIEFARKLTTSLAYALENARLHEEQKNIAQRLQQALLDIPSQTRGVQFGHLYRSATLEASVGGDFYDVFAVKHGRIAVLIGDVSGHGVEAARVATMVKDVVHAFAHQFRRPNVVLRKTNELLIEKRTPGFVSLFLGVLDPEQGILTYATGGHPNALVRTGDGEVEALKSGSAPMGVFTDYSWKEHEAHLSREDLLLLYTDGAIEARREGEFFGQEGVARVLESWPEPSPELLPQAVLSEVLAFSGGVLSDDVAILALRLTGEPAPE